MFFCPIQIESRWPQVAPEPCNVTSVTKELGFMFHFVLITFKIEKSHVAGCGCISAAKESALRQQSSAKWTSSLQVRINSRQLPE